MTNELVQLLQSGSGRSELNEALKTSIPEMVVKIDEKLPKKPFYLAGAGYGFDEFSTRIAKAYPGRILGAAAIWTKPSEIPFPSGVRSFNIVEEMIEPLAGKPQLLLCQPIIADAFEILTIVSRLEEEIQFESLLIATLLINEDVRRTLKFSFSALGKYPQDVACVKIEKDGLITSRDTLYNNLDDRPLQIVPPMSRWMMKRAFGPEPKKTAAPAPGYRPRS